jgi:hypothetical protein
MTFPKTFAPHGQEVAIRGLCRPGLCRPLLVDLFGHDLVRVRTSFQILSDPETLWF